MSTDSPTISQVDLGKATDYLNAWASTHRFRAAGGAGYPSSTDVDKRVRLAARTRPDHLPSVGLRFLTVETWMASQPDHVRELILHVYPTVGTYYSGKSTRTFRHEGVRHIPDPHLRADWLDAIIRKVRIDLAVEIKND